MKMRLFLFLLLTLLALKGNLNAASIVTYGTDGGETRSTWAHSTPTPYCNMAEAETIRSISLGPQEVIG